MDRRWILYLLLAGLMVAIIWRNEFSDRLTQAGHVAQNLCWNRFLPQTVPCAIRVSRPQANEQNMAKIGKAENGQKI